MDSVGKSFSLFLVCIIAVSSLIMVKPAFAQSIPKPSVPTFTLQYVDNSYDVPLTYGIDPYTGNNIMTHVGYHVQNESVEVLIKNQPFTAYHNENGSLVWLFYVIDIKGHFENWTTENWTSQNINLTSESYPDGYIPSSDSEYTVMTYGLGGDNGTGKGFYYGYYGYTLGNVSVGGQVDFKVQAIIGYSTRVNETIVPGFPVSDPHYYIFTGESSDWSSTQTITIPSGSTSTITSPNPTPTLTVPELSWLAILPLFVFGLLIAVKLRLKNQARLKNSQFH